MIDSEGEGVSACDRRSLTRPRSKNAMVPKVYRWGSPSTLPYQASAEVMSLTDLEIWPIGPSFNNEVIGLSCRFRALPLGARNHFRNAFRLARPNLVSAFLI